MVLSPEQQQWIREIFDGDTSLAVKSCMRGEGKSTECAGIAIWRAFDKNISGAPQIPIIATTLKQAQKSIYDVILAMVRAEPELYTRSLEYNAQGNQKLIVPSTSGEIFPMANDPDGLQGLDPLLAVMDEIGFQGQASWDAIQLASGKRPDSLVMGVGTPGFDKDNALWGIRKVLKEGGAIDGLKYREDAAPEGADHTDEAVWYACSPALRAGYKNIKALRTAVRLTPEAHFRIFHLGQWVDGANSWLGPRGGQIWDEGNTEYTPQHGVPTWVGLDIGIVSDTAAMIFIQERQGARPTPEGNHLFAWAQVWHPSKERGRVDVSDIQQSVRDAADMFHLQGVWYDPRLFELAGNQLLDEGYPLMKTPQSWEAMGPAYLELYRTIHDGRLSHPDDPVFRTQVLNGVARFNERGFMVSKDKSSGKIDCVPALNMAHMGYSLRTPPRPPLAIA
jgi:phage terminase large subunit-like protein